MSTFDGFVFTPETKAQQARAKIDRSLDDIVRESVPAQKDRRKRNSRERDRQESKKYIDLPLNDREVKRYLQIADFDPEGCDVRLRLVLLRNSQSK
jgi:hypothetical protein